MLEKNKNKNIFTKYSSSSQQSCNGPRFNEMRFYILILGNVSKYLGWLDPHLHFRESPDPDPDRTNAGPDLCIHDTKDRIETNHYYVKKEMKYNFTFVYWRN
jgi:hypothetical protein